MRDLTENSGLYAAYEAVLKAASSIVDASKSEKVQASLQHAKVGEYHDQTALEVAKGTLWAPLLKKINGATFVVLLSNLSLQSLKGIQLTRNSAELGFVTTLLADQSKEAQTIRTTLHRLIFAKWDNPKFNYSTASDEEKSLHLYANLLKQILAAWSAVYTMLQEKEITPSSIKKSIQGIDAVYTVIESTSCKNHLPEAWITTLTSLLEKDKETLKNIKDVTPPENIVFSPASPSPASPSHSKTTEEIRNNYYRALGFWTIPTTPPSPPSPPSPW